jgi:CubicO group peptidase (beta-lactamase class C family)
MLTQGRTDELARLMQGFPPPPEARVTLANWQEPPYNRWSFQHVREIIPTQRIYHGTGDVTLLPYALADVDDVAVRCVDGSRQTFAEVLGRTWTDAALVLHDGRIVAEHYDNGMSAETTHILMSCTKSLVGCVVGILVDRGLLHTAARVTHYVPELSGSGWADATVRDVLDMRSAVRFSEDYTDLEAEVRVIERAMGWRPWEEGLPTNMYEYLTTLGRMDDHDGTFVYRSAETDVLGWICERVADTRMADLISMLLWQPLGTEFDAEITVGNGGVAVHDGGGNATLRDMARFGLMLLGGGHIAGRQVVPRWWLDDCWAVPHDLVEAFARSESGPYLPGGWYRNQFWFLPCDHGVALLALGIHGQMVFVQPATRTVAVKLSSWPTAQAAGQLRDAAHAFDAVGAVLCG